MALGVLRALHEAGCEIPRAGQRRRLRRHPRGAYYTPPLTTVRQDFREIGSRSLRLLLEMIADGGEAQSPPLVAPELILRSSTTRAPG